MRALILISLASALLSGCATPGAPQPPSLNIPAAVTDLRAERKGDVVTLTWTAPQETTDGALVHKSGKMIVRRTSEPSAPVVISELPLPSAKKSQAAQAERAQDSLTAVLATPTADFANYTVEALTASGKSAGLSNQVAVPLVAALPAPEGVQAKTVPQGVSLAWKQTWPPRNSTHLSARYAYRIMRRAQGGQPAMLAQVDAGNEAMLFIDTSIEWEKQYEYWIAPVTIWENPAHGNKGEVPGEESQTVTITATDVFPPAAPVGLQAAFSGSLQQLFIDLAWTPNSESDLAGYNIYRRSSDEQQFQKLNTALVKEPAYRDKAVQPGMKYFYAVTAVDLRSNESPKSAEASESVPRE
ncbi:MAG TPA: hypothetical protein VKT33_09120 [Candidatus Angelobacter sp.]|nr:hypothetical protein [Candidatus Angelobacter sp.]